MSETNDKITKVSIVCSKGSLEGIYPALIMANGARMEGIEASIFFTFFGLYAILKKYNDKIKIATVDMFHLSEDDFCDEVKEVLTVGQFYELSAGAQIIFT